MKRRDLIKLFEDNGFVFVRNGGNHDIYKRGDEREVVERHSEIPEKLAKKIIKRRNLVKKD